MSPSRVIETGAWRIDMQLVPSWGGSDKRDEVITEGVGTIAGGTNRLVFHDLYRGGPTGELVCVAHQPTVDQITIYGADETALRRNIDDVLGAMHIKLETPTDRI